MCDGWDRPERHHSRIERDVNQRTGKRSSALLSIRTKRRSDVVVFASEDRWSATDRVHPHVHDGRNPRHDRRRKRHRSLSSARRRTVDRRTSARCVARTRQREVCGWRDFRPPPRRTDSCRIHDEPRCTWFACRSGRNVHRCHIHPLPQRSGQHPSAAHPAVSTAPSVASIPLSCRVVCTTFSSTANRASFRTSSSCARVYAIFVLIRSIGSPSWWSKSKTLPTNSSAGIAPFVPEGTERHRKNGEGSHTCRGASIGDGPGRSISRAIESIPRRGLQSPSLILCVGW